MGKTDAKTVADWLVAFHHEHGDQPTNLRLQKLLYYAQAWYLVFNDGEPLFDEDFEAWIHGPVIPSVYRTFREHGSSPIPAQTPIPREDAEPSFVKPNVGQEVSDHLSEVMNAYGGLSTWHLEQLTHQEDPWKKSRGGLPSDASCKTVIPKAEMQTYYAKLLREQEENSKS